MLRLRGICSLGAGGDREQELTHTDSGRHQMADRSESALSRSAGSWDPARSISQCQGSPGLGLAKNRD